jgi:hypothetical protein
VTSPGKGNWGDDTIQHTGDENRGIALALVIVQLFLGVGAYLTRLGSPGEPQPLNPMVAITVAHVACGALVFVTTIVLTLRTYRVLPATGEERESTWNARPQES